MFVEWKTSKFRGAPQKPLGSSPHFVMLNDCKHGIQVPVHRIARTTCLKYVPRMSELFKPSPKAIFRCLIFRGAMWWPQCFGDRRGPSQQSRAYRARSGNFPNGCHVCEVEIDPETGATRVVGYWVVDDVGTVINPLLVKGQIMGGIAQGMGQVLMEDKAYDEEGQALTGSFMDYAMPRVEDFCNVVIEDTSFAGPLRLGLFHF